MVIGVSINWHNHTADLLQIAANVWGTKQLSGNVITVCGSHICCDAVNFVAQFAIY